MFSLTISTQQTTVISTTTATIEAIPPKPPRRKAIGAAPEKPPRHRQVAQKTREQWQTVPFKGEKKVRTEEEIREQMGAVGRAIEDHPNIYTGVTIVGVLSAIYGLSVNICGAAETNMALARIVTNLTNFL